MTIRRTPGEIYEFGGQREGIHFSRREAAAHHGQSWRVRVRRRSFVYRLCTNSEHR